MGIVTPCFSLIQRCSPKTRNGSIPNWIRDWLYPKFEHFAAFYRHTSSYRLGLSSIQKPTDLAEPTLGQASALAYVQVPTSQTTMGSLDLGGASVPWLTFAAKMAVGNGSRWRFGLADSNISSSVFIL